MDCVTLHTGQRIPVVGYGTWNAGKDAVGEAVKLAIDTGYTHIDCARAYGNEEEVGRGIQAKLQDGSITRDKLVITSKLWNTYHRPDLVRKCVDETLAALQLSYLDVYLMHWPVALKEDGPMIPKDEEGNLLFSDADYLDAYKAMEKLVDEGLVRAIGLSNFNPKQIQRVLDNCRIKPAMIQFEVHPYFNQQTLIDFCRSKDIHITGYSPLGSPARPWAVSGEARLVDDARVQAIAAKHNKSAGQVLIRYALERGLAILTKSVTPSRIKDNIEVMNFRLSEEDMAILNGMESGHRALLIPHWIPSKYYPFKDSAL